MIAPPQFLTRLADQQGIALEVGVIDQIVDEILAKAGLQDIEAIAAEAQRWFDSLSQLQPI